MVSRRSRRRSSPRGISLAAAAGVGLFVLAFSGVGVGGYYYWTAQRPPIIDKLTGCPVEGARSLTVILVDASDELTDLTRREIRTLVLDVAEATPAYGLLDLRYLDPSGGGAISLFARCSPPSGAGMSDVSANPALAKKRWTESFIGPAQEAIIKSLAPATSKTSPIMGAIQQIDVERFSGEKVAGVSKRLVIVSDLIENTQYYSQYSGDLSFKRYLNSPASRRFATDLAGAEVTVKYIVRNTPRKIDSGAHIAFWNEWFRSNNGRLKEAAKLQGVD